MCKCDLFVITKWPKMNLFYDGFPSARYGTYVRYIYMIFEYCGTVMGARVDIN